MYSTIYKILGNAIQVGQLEPGVVLLETPLAEAFGASNVPVRQALELLEKHGLVRRFNGRGLMVGRESVTPKKLDVARLGIESLRNRPPTWQSISDEVERVIINRAIWGASRLNEVGLARYYQIGRTVAHSVLTRLESVGIIEKDTSSRWNIVSLDARRLSNLYEIREHLEPLALAYAIPLVTPSRISQYRADHEKAQQLYPLIPTSELDRLELQLHVDLIGECNNRELLEVLHRTRLVFSVSKQLYGLESQPPRQEPFLAEHIDVLKAAERGSGHVHEAAELLRQHIRASGARLIDALPTLQSVLTPIDLPYLSERRIGMEQMNWPRIGRFKSTPEGS